MNENPIRFFSSKMLKSETSFDFIGSYYFYKGHRMKNRLFTHLIAFTTPLIASDLGRNTYEITCKTCHAPPFAKRMHAPAAFDKKAWSIRFNKAEIESKDHPDQFKTAIDYLFYKASIGKGLMPHGGLCKEADVPHKNCSDKAIKEAIYYMANITIDN